MITAWQGEHSFCGLFYSYLPKSFAFRCEAKKSIIFAIINLPYTHFVSNKSKGS